MTYTVSVSDGKPLRLNERDETAAVLQNIAILLATRQGTIPLYRDFGLPQRFLDKPMAIAGSLLCLEVKEAVEEWEPRAEVVSVSFEADIEKPGRLLPRVEVKIKNEQ